MTFTLNEKITPNFFYKEALFLFKWQIYVFPQAHILQNIKFTAEKMELIRTYCGNRRIIVRSWFRPPRYNFYIGGATKSMHLTALACDFVVDGLKAYEVRELLKPKLEEFKIRMEQLEDLDPWVHIDLKEPGHSGRYFKP